MSYFIGDLWDESLVITRQSEEGCNIQLPTGGYGQIVMI